MNYKLMGHAICVILLAGIITPGAASSEEQIKMSEIRSVTGDVEAKDSFHSSLVIRWIDNTFTLKKDEMCLSVTKETVITRGTSKIKLDQLNTGDRVTVRYYPQTYDFPRALTIIVKD